MIISIQTEIRKYVGEVKKNTDLVILTADEATVSEKQFNNIMRINFDAIKVDAGYAGTYSEHIKAAEENHDKPDSTVVASLEKYKEHLGYLRARKESLLSEWSLEHGVTLYFNKPPYLDDILYNAITLENDTDNSFVTTPVKRICAGSKL